MNKYTFLSVGLFFVLFHFSAYSQASKSSEEDLKKNQFIYLNASDRISTTTTQNYSTGKSSSASSRIINFTFSVGKDGIEKNVGKKFEKLENYIKNDPQAYSEFKIAREHQRKAQKYNIIQLLGYPLALAAVVPACIAFYKKDDTGETDYGLFVISGVGIVGGFVIINVWGAKCEKELDALVASVYNCVAIYNQNLLLKTNK